VAATQPASLEETLIYPASSQTSTFSGNSTAGDTQYERRSWVYSAKATSPRVGMMNDCARKR
jgi:hypothetical protein